MPHRVRRAKRNTFAWGKTTTIQRMASAEEFRSLSTEYESDVTLC
jgi:hypothetical protein